MKKSKSKFSILKFVFIDVINFCMFVNFFVNLTTTYDWQPIITRTWRHLVSRKERWSIYNWVVHPATKVKPTEWQIGSTKSLFTWRWDISEPRDNFVPGSHENWVGYYPGAIRTRHNNTRENCILNMQDGVQQNLCYISFLDTSLFAAVLYQSNGFLFAYCACSHLASAISAMLASMCEYWSCALQSKLSRLPEISRCRAFTWIIIVPGSPSEISRSSELSRFHVNGQAFKTEKHVRTGVSLPPEISRLMWTGSKMAATVVENCQTDMTLFILILTYS